MISLLEQAIREHLAAGGKIETIEAQPVNHRTSEIRPRPRCTLCGYAVRIGCRCIHNKPVRIP